MEYSLTTGSSFQPFSYQELVAPILLATQAHLQLEDAYGELTTKASVWEGLANQLTDPTTYNLYKLYANDLNNAAAQLAHAGLNPLSRLLLNSMNKRYAKEITPIENAYIERKADIERQKKVQDASGGRTVFTRDARTTSLDDYMNGIQDYGLANLDNVFNEAAAGAKAISSRYFSTKEGKLFGGDYNNLITEKGLSPIQAILVLEGKYGDSNLFQDFKDFISRGLSKYSSFGNTPERDAINNAFMQGINAGIVYEQDNKPMENWRTKMALLDFYDQKKYNREHPQPEGMNVGLASIIAVPEVEALDSNRKEREKIRLFIKDWRADKTGKFLQTDNKANPKDAMGYDPTYDVFATGQSLVQDRKAFWNEMNKKYGAGNSPEKMLQILKEQEKNEVKMYLKYIPNTAGFDNIMNGILAKLMAEPNKGIHLIENGKIKSGNVDLFTFRDAIKNGSTPYYSARLNSFVISGVDSKNKPKEFAIDPEFIDPSINERTGRLKIVEQMEDIQELFKKGDSQSALEYIDEMIRWAVITPSNSRILRQGETTSKEETMFDQMGSTY